MLTLQKKVKMWEKCFSFLVHFPFPLFFLSCRIEVKVKWIRNPNFQRNSYIWKIFSQWKFYLEVNLRWKYVYLLNRMKSKGSRFLLLSHSCMYTRVYTEFEMFWSFNELFQWSSRLLINIYVFFFFLFFFYFRMTSSLSGVGMFWAFLSVTASILCCSGYYLPFWIQVSILKIMLDYKFFKLTKVHISVPVYLL